MSATRQPTRLAVLGAGHVGPVIARLALEAGYQVAIATSGDPADIALITELVIPGARPRWASDAVADADIVVLAIPLHRFLDVTPAAERQARRGRDELLAGQRRRPGRLRRRRQQRDRGPAAGRPTVVKALNHIGYHELEDRARPAGAPDRQAAGVAGDDPGAVTTIAGLVDALGYDPVRLDSLRAGWVLQPGGPVFGVVLTAPEFERAVRADAGSLA